MYFCRCLLHVGLPLMNTTKLQVVQNAVSLMLLSKPKFHCATPLLQEFYYCLALGPC